MRAWWSAAVAGGQFGRTSIQPHQVQRATNTTAAPPATTLFRQLPQQYSVQAVAHTLGGFSAFILLKRPFFVCLLLLLLLFPRFQKQKEEEKENKNAAHRVVAAAAAVALVDVP